jgi:cell division control protein 6
MVALSESSKQVFTTGEVAQVYRDVAKLMDIDVLTHRRITDLISELSMLGIISTRVVSRGRYGRTKEMWFATSTKRIQGTLLKDSRIDEEKLNSINMERYRTLFH